MAADLRDGRIKIRGTLEQIGPESIWFFVILAVVATIVLGAAYRAVTAAETLLRDGDARRPH